MKRVLFLVNHDVVIYNFRLEIVERLLMDRHQVHISSPYGERIDELIALGCVYHKIGIERHGLNPIKELELIKQYKLLIRNIKPDIIFGFTIKPNIYGAISARKYRIPFVVNITGLGTAVEHKGILQKVIICLYRYVFRSVQTVFVQNEGNRQFFIKHRIAVDKLKLLPGSGVNIAKFSYEKYLPREFGEDIFLFVGRIMKDKGIDEYLEAAEKIKEQFPGVLFEIVGFMDGEYRAKLDEAEKRKTVIYYGEQSDVQPFYKRCSAVVLPSYHEGMANVLLEASAVGRPVLASNIHGCKETFKEGITGFGFEPKNALSLYEVLKKFILLSKEQKKRMGKAGREKVEQEFDRQIVVEKYMKEIEGKEHIKN